MASLSRVWVYGTALVLAGLGMSSTALVLAFFALIIPGLILLAAPTAALYLPFADAILTGLRRRNRVRAAIGVVAGGAIAFGLPLASGFVLDRQVAAERRGDFAHAALARPRELLVYGHYRSEDRHLPGQWSYESSKGAACDELCARLLLGRQVDAVVRPIRRGHGPLLLDHGYTGPAVVYTLVAAPTCPRIEREQLDVSAETLAAIGLGQCIRARETERPTFDAALTTLHDTASIGRFDLLRPGLSTVTRRTAWRCLGRDCEPSAVATTVEARRLAAPLYIGVASTGSIDMPRELGRKNVSAGATASDATFLAENLDLRARPLPGARADQIQAAALRLLAVTTASPRSLSEPERAAIEASLSTITAAPGSPSETDLQLLKAIANHPRADQLFGFDDVFRKHPEAATRLADDLAANFLRLSATETGRQHELRRDLAQALATLPPDVLARHRGELLSAGAADKYALRDAPELIGRLAEFGPQAVPVLIEALQLPNDDVAAAFSLCRIGPPAAGAAGAVARLQDDSARDSSGERTKSAAVVLARLGRGDLIRQRPDSAFAHSNAITRERGRRWYALVLPTITPASPPDVCSSKTIERTE